MARTPENPSPQEQAKMQRLSDIFKKIVTGRFDQVMEPEQLGTLDAFIREQARPAGGFLFGVRLIDANVYSPFATTDSNIVPSGKAYIMQTQQQEEAFLKEHEGLPTWWFEKPTKDSPHQ